MYLFISCIVCHFTSLFDLFFNHFKSSTGKSRGLLEIQLYNISSRLPLKSHVQPLLEDVVIFRLPVSESYKNCLHICDSDMEGR